MANREVQFVIRSLDQFTERLIKKLTLDLTANLIESTPVDTGWARANWIPAIGMPFDGTAGTRDQAEQGNISVAEQSSGQASILSYRLSRGQVFISNNVPYITDLEGGTSTQAPTGFMLQSIDKALSQLKNVRSVR